FHIVTFLVCTGSLSLRASIHGLVINTIHSLCTCTSPQFSEERKRVLRMSLDEYSLAKFYSLFGISKVKSPAVMAFRSRLFQPRTRWELSQPDTVTVHQKIRPKDVPGTLLNMALLNLGSSDPSLRTAAYNLLCAVTATFDLA
ncbi:unnamed protein product, partial [Notodromas monacha]